MRVVHVASGCRLTSFRSCRADFAGSQAASMRIGEAGRASKEVCKRGQEVLQVQGQRQKVHQAADRRCIKQPKVHSDRRQVEGASAARLQTKG